MKIDRLLGIVTYLLNHDAATARTLAEKFEVSLRTIQRDMDSLSLAGIPVVSLKGAAGGYGIAEGFRLNGQLASTEDYLHMATALKVLCSGYGSKKLEATLEKLTALLKPGQQPESKIHIDLGVLKEVSQVNDCIALIEKAVEMERAVEFDYTDAGNRTSHRVVEPLRITYKWYAWYLFGYCREKKDYRLFRLSRVCGLTAAGSPFSLKHGNVDELMREYDKKDTRCYMDIKLRCCAELKIAAAEAFPGAEITGQDGGEIIVRLRVPENERMWFGALLSFGAGITVLEPEELKTRLVERAREILKLYE